MLRELALVAFALSHYAGRSERPIDYLHPDGRVKTVQELRSARTLNRRERYALEAFHSMLLTAPEPGRHDRLLNLHRLDSGKGIWRLYEEVVTCDCSLHFNKRIKRVERRASNIEMHVLWKDLALRQIVRIFRPGGKMDNTCYPWAFRETRKPYERIIDTVERLLREEPKIEAQRCTLDLALLNVRPEPQSHESLAYPGILSVTRSRIVRWRLPEQWWPYGLQIFDKGSISWHDWRPAPPLPDGPWKPIHIPHP